MNYNNVSSIFQRIGQGVMFYNYGGCYRGQWQSDLKHGNGLMEFRDGRSYDGEWNNNAVSKVCIQVYCQFNLQ